jgi:hypothetical protein
MNECDNFDFEPEISELDRKNEILDGIRYLYDNVVKTIHNVDNPVFNPDIFAYLTEDQFRNWIFKNNLLL